MRIVVTGATGNVGTALLPRLLAAPGVTSVVGLARRLPARPDPDVQWHAADVADGDLRALFDGADVVVHQAFLLQPAHRPAEMERVNVLGSQRVFDAVAAAGVPALVHASSLGAYSAGPKTPRAGEDHPTGGIPASVYSRHKATVERALDRFEAAHPERRVVRVRPGVVLQPAAASAIARYFLGPLVPQTLLRRSLLPLVPAVDRLAVQVVHAADLADAYVRTVLQPVTGAFNIAADPVLDPPTLARALHARQVPLPASVLRTAVDLLWRLHVQPTDPGWIDLARQTPLMDTTRARTELGWEPRHDAVSTLLDFLAALNQGQGAPTPVLRPRASGPTRLLDAAKGLLPGGNG